MNSFLQSQRYAHLDVGIFSIVTHVLILSFLSSLFHSLAPVFLPLWYMFSNCKTIKITFSCSKVVERLIRSISFLLIVIHITNKSYILDFFFDMMIWHYSMHLCNISIFHTKRYDDNYRNSTLLVQSKTIFCSITLDYCTSIKLQKEAKESKE